MKEKRKQKQKLGPGSLAVFRALVERSSIIELFSLIPLGPVAQSNYSSLEQFFFFCW
jgi:hypothetical protein